MGNNETPETIIERADAAKQAGRNQTFIHDGRAMHHNPAAPRAGENSQRSAEPNSDAEAEPVESAS
jgi:hypothetical protein